MAWIESHQDLKDHPKLSDLCVALSWEKSAAIGRLHLFWWWCVDYAEDGDLRRHNDGRIALAMGVAMDESKTLVQAMIGACWLDREPYFRVHDWWDYVGRFLQVKYKNYPDKWHKVRDLYASNGLQHPLEPPLAQITDRPTNRTDIHTDPNKGIRDMKSFAVSDSLVKHVSTAPNGNDWNGLTLTQKTVQLLGASEMILKDQRWQKRIQSNPTRLERIVDTIHAEIAQGKVFKKRGAYAQTLWDSSKFE